MPFIATKINCDGDKCGACAFRITSVCPFHFGKNNTEYYNWLNRGMRYPECLAGELRRRCFNCSKFMDEEDWCEAIRDSDDEDACQTDCTDNGYPWWQPATKGERSANDTEGRDLQTITTR